MNQTSLRSNASQSSLPIYASVASYAIGQGMIIPAIPLYAYSLGATQTVLGLIGTLPAVTYAILAVIVGQLSEKKGRRIFIVFGLLLYLLVNLAYLVSSDLNQILAVRSFEGISFAFFWPCVEAYIADRYEGVSQRRAIGYYTIAWSGGATLGPIIGGCLINITSIQSPFAASAVATLTSLIFILTHTDKTGSHRKILKDSTGKASHSLRSILYAILGYAFAQATVLSLYPVHGTTIGFTEIEIGVLLSLMSLARTSIFISTTYWKPFSKKETATVGYYILAASLGLIPILDRFFTSAIGFMIMGIGLGLVYVSIIDLALSHQRKGSAAGAFESGIGVGAVAGPFISGVMAEHTGFQAAYWLSGFIAILGTIFVKKAYKKGRTQNLVSIESS